MLVPARPMDRGGSDSGLAHFYDVFNDRLVLVFVRHENELDKVPAAVKKGFHGRKKAALPRIWPWSRRMPRNSFVKYPSAARIPTA